MTRYVSPELFRAAGGQITAGGAPRVALRWLLHSSVGLPRALFHVWHFEGRVPTRETAVSTRPLDTGERALSWAAGPAAAVQLNVNAPAGAILVLRGFSGAAGTGHAVDEDTVVGPATNRAVVLVGSPVASVLLIGSGTASVTRVVPIDTFVNDPGWRLVETVGLPVDDSFGPGGYPLDAQGPVGSERPPVDAAVTRVKVGTPDAGWDGVTDRGSAVPAFEAPDPTQLVTEELTPLLEMVRRLLEEVADPAGHADKFFPVKVTAPRSVHGVDASPHWQGKARDSELQPLASLLLAAGSDPFAALALGFGTTVDFKPQQPPGGIAPPPVVFDFYMVTVKHKVSVAIDVPPFDPIELPVEGELAALCMEVQKAPLPAPAAVAAEPGPLDPRPRLDPPGEVDGRWVEAPQVSWAVPVITADSSPRPAGYAVARGFGATALEVRNEPRLSGGWNSFAAAEDPDKEPPAVVRFTDTGVPERFPGDPTTVVYSVAATDWFGRWSPWVSADHARLAVAPQVPAVRRVSLEVAESAAPLHPATAAVEFTWDWSHRRPREITLRLLVHAEGTPPPVVDGSVLRVGGPTVGDTGIDFSAASIDTPPAGVTTVPDETSGNLRTYRVTIPGLAFAFDTHPRVRVTVRARATERVGFGLLSAFSPDGTAQAASPIPPPPPFVPAAMVWASVPDPKGVARVTLTWSASAPRYAVYLADETAVCRELGLPSPDLEVSAADRLIGLRPQPFGQARRAFRRVADNVTTTALPVELERGSRMIHFYAVVSVSATGAEVPLPTEGNDYLAVAAPVARVPEVPKIVARDRGGVVALLVEVPETRVPVGRVEIFRAPSRHRAVMPEHAGPPIAVVGAASGVRAGGVIRFELEDPAPGVAWQSVFYRAVAWAETDTALGIFGGRSEPTRAVEVVVTSAAPPPLADLNLEDVAGVMDHRLVSFRSDATLARTPRGAHVFAVQVVMPDATVATRRAPADTLPLLSGAFPGPAVPPDPDIIFRHDPANPRSGRTYAWVPREATAVIVEVADPGGRTTRQTRTVP
jgi:hypothetical protein